MAQTTVTEQQTITVETELGDIAKYLNATTLQLQQMTFIYNSIQGFPEAEVKALFNIIDQIVICSNNISSIVTTAGIETEITALAGIQAELEALFASLATIQAVFDNLTAINGVNAISADVTGVNAISADVTTLAGISGAITALNAELAALVAINTNLAALLNLNTNTQALLDASTAITDSIDPTGAPVAGQIFRVATDGDPAVRISEVEQFKNNRAFARSPLQASNYSKYNWVWDNVIRADTASGTIGTTDNGLAYNHFGLPFEWKIESNQIATSGDNQYAVVDRNGLGSGSVGFEFLYNRILANNRDLTFIIAKDIDNWIGFNLTSFNFFKIKTAGVESTLQTVSVAGKFELVDINHYQIILSYSTISGRSSIRLRNLTTGEDGMFYRETASELLTIFPTADDVRYVGFAKLGGGADLSNIQAWRSYNIQRTTDII